MNIFALITQQLKALRTCHVCAQGVKSIYTYEIRSCECAGGEDGRKRKHVRL